MAKFISDKVRYAWFVFAANWARYVILGGLIGLSFLIGRCQGAG